MKLPTHPTLLRRMRDARVKELVARCPPLAASLGRQAGGGAHVTWKHKGKTRTVYVPKDLAASLGRQAGGGAHVTWKHKGKTRTVYVPKDLTDEVTASIREHQRLKRLLREISQLQLALIRGHKEAQARRAGRA